MRGFRRIGFAVWGLVLALPVAVLPAWQVRAQLQLPGQSGDSDQPIQIQSDSGIEWQQDAHLYIARGNAVAVRGSSEVHADTLIAHYREKGLLRVVDADADMNTVFKTIQQAIG